MSSRRYSLDKARAFLEEAYENGYTDARSQTIAALGAERLCPDGGWHAEHFWADGKTMHWCPGRHLINVEF